MSRLIKVSFRGKLQKLSMKKDSSDGAIALVLALLVSGALVVGLLALVVDVGSQYQERRVLQKVADSLALAIGQDCAEGNALGLCIGTLQLSGAQHPASRYAVKNSDDGKTRIDEVCGRGYPGLADCGDQTSKLLGCSAVRPDIESYVRVKVKTLTSNENSSLKFRFAIPGGDSSSAPIRACSQVRFGITDKAPVIFPFALSLCGYEDSSREYLFVAYSEDAGSKFVKSPTYVKNILTISPFPVTGASKYFTLRDNAATASTGGLCNYKPIGSSVWIPVVSNLETQDVLDGGVLFRCVGSNVSTECAVSSDLQQCPNLFNPINIKVGDFIDIIPPGNTNAIPNNCDDVLTANGLAGNTPKVKFENYLLQYVINKPIYIPVFFKEIVNQTGTNAASCDIGAPCPKKLEVAGFYTVIIKAISLGSSAAAGSTPFGPAGSANSWPKKSLNFDGDSFACTSADYCIYGKFTRATPPNRVRTNPLDPNLPNTGVGYVYLFR